MWYNVGIRKRNPLQVEVLIYQRKPNGGILVLGLRRIEELGNFWQPVTGGVMKGEDIKDAALREVQEETGISQPIRLYSLNYMFTFPNEEPYKKLYDEDITEIKEFTFGFETDTEVIKLSKEHAAYQWMSPEKAMSRFKFAENKEALKRLIHQLEND